ncbi:MAG: MoxR family ATPase [Gammaproteobacteria bacterium]|nr:MoxR family ATPase [Gammaproteobacteria bacterium]NNK99224.1 MoxR family ATPase [Xanthomonadales bacterium]
MTSLDSIHQLKARMAESVIGQEAVIEQLLIGLLANGNILMEGLPGLAKTRSVKSLASNMDADFSRIQFTPDLLPSDITGSEVLYTESGQPTFRFEEGPIFANIVLADEINRAPAKVQAALLEAMEERQVTVSGKTHKMPELFIVMATQNPIEQEGTYPLPEAQMDRFLLHVYIDYGTEEGEAKVIRLVRGEEGTSPTHDDHAPVVQQVVFDARREINQVKVSEVIESYIVDLVFATRFPERYDEKLASWIRIGASPRGAIGLDKCARVHAWLNGRDHVLPDDVRAVVHGVLRHRIALSYEANADAVSSNDVIDEILKLVAVA